MDPKISIVVLVWNGDAYIDACLKALLAQAYAPFEVIVVDNASTDQSVSVIEQHAPNVRLIQNSYNFGFAGGNNIGIQAASGDIVILLNQDTTVHPGWLRAIADTFALDPAIGVVGCKMLYPNSNTIQHAGAWVRAGDAFAYHFGQGEDDHGQYDEMKDVEYVTAAAFALSRAVLDAVGYLDEQLHPGFYEDPDYCWRARRAGFRTVYQPKAVLVHHETTSLPSQSYQRVAAFHRNRIRFVLKHWKADALKEFNRAEQDATASTLGLDDAVARGHGYWSSLTALPSILRQRQDDPLLGSALTAGEIRWLFDALQSLRQQAYDRAGALLNQTNPLGKADRVDRPHVEFTEIQPAAVTPAPSLTFPTWDQLQTQIQATAHNPQLHEYVFRSQIPLVGRWIAWFRTLWNSVSTRWYVLPVMEQQSAFNLQVCRTLETMNTLLAEMMQTLERHETLAPTVELQHQQIALQRQQMSELQIHINDQIDQIRQQLENLPPQVEARQQMQRNLLAEDDASIVEALRVLILNAQNKEGDQSG